MSSYNFYPDAQTFNVRDEIRDMLFGDFTQPGIGRPLLVRRIRDQKCACYVKASGSPLPGCRYCGGEGFLWTETLETGYIAKNMGSVLGATTVIANQNALAQWGQSDENKAIAYLQAAVFPNYERYLIPSHPTFDKLFELKVDDEGTLVTPVVRTAKWKIRVLTPHHGDYGRVEFFELGLDKEM